MGDAKIDIKIGDIQFSGEGNQDWVAEQLDKILSKAEDLVKIAPPPTTTDPLDGNSNNTGSDTTIAGKTLPSFLGEKSATRVQVKKFLATAVWLNEKGKSRIKTNDVAKALKDSNQSRLGNAADCLNQNVSKGYCEKDGSEFFVTDEGRDSL